MAGATRGRLTVLVAAGAIALLSASCSGAGSTPAASGSVSSVSATPSGAAAPSDTAAPDAVSAASGSALALLATLAVKGRAPRTGYDRERFGTAWTDDTTAPLGHNGCDTRNDVLRRDLVDVTLKPDTHGCAVLTGTLHDPYRGATIGFVRGPATSTAVQIDHVVALGDAWQTGAQRWDDATRAEFANDPLELLAVDGSANESKGDGDAATWLPPRTSYRCAYVARQVAVKARYGLWTTPAEHAAIARILTGCPDQLAPVESGTARVGTAAPSTQAPPPTAGVSTSITVVYYPDCAAVRAAGAAPLHRGDPGYSRRLDRDGDGTACE